MLNRITRIKSKRGGEVIIYDNFIYNYHSDVKDTAHKRFRCSKRTCTGVLVLENDIIVSLIGHNHEPEIEKS